MPHDSSKVGKSLDIFVLGVCAFFSHDCSQSCSCVRVFSIINYLRVWREATELCRRGTPETIPSEIGNLDREVAVKSASHHSNARSRPNYEHKLTRRPVVDAVVIIVAVVVVVVRHLSEL